MSSESSRSRRLIANNLVICDTLYIDKYTTIPPHYTTERILVQITHGSLPNVWNEKQLKYCCQLYIDAALMGHIELSPGTPGVSTRNVFSATLVAKSVDKYREATYIQAFLIKA